MLFQLLIYIPVIFGIIVISLLTWYRQRSAMMKASSALYFSIALWLLAQLFIQVRLFNQPLVFARITDVLVNYVAYFFMAFTYLYTTHSSATRKKALMAFAILPLLFTPLAFTQYGLQQIEVNSIGFAVKKAGLGYSLQLAYIGVYLVAGYLLVVRDTLKKPKALRTTNYILLVAMLQTGVINLLTNSVFANVAATQLITPVTLFAMVALTAYAIIKHRLFDIRLIVARSLAYLFSLLSLGSIFTLVAYGITATLFDNDVNIVALRWLYAALAVILAILFPYLKHFFDRTTNRLFFRDSYDTQVFFDDFNKTLVETYELDQLLKESVKIIEQNIKPVHCQFVINKTSNTEGRIMGTANRPALDTHDIKIIKEAVDKSRRKLVVADELETKHESLQKHLRAKDIVLAAALTNSTGGRKTEVGYLLLGPKKSGNLYSSQDIKVLEIVANELVIAVQNALRFEEIESFNITLQAKVDEATKKLRRANEKLKALDETKDDFISMASHQLRTPLTSVKGYVSMVLEGDTGKITPKQREMLNQAFFSSQRMVYLIADLLNVSRLKTGKFVIEATPVNLADVVEQELSQLQETAAARQLKLTYEKPKKFPALMLDETKTRQVIMNFVDNAIYYTPSGGQIKVHLVDNPTTVELRVEDNGIGVPAAERPHLFTKFYRAGNARKARPDGTGLGLFMAKKVIVAQGGSLMFESQEGKGSMFGFIFSKAKHAVPAQSASDNAAVKAKAKEPATAKV